MTEREQKIQKLKTYFEKRDDIVMAFLFGSQATGRTMYDSDWDIAVYFKPVVEPVEWEEQNREYPEEDHVWNDCIDIVKTDSVDLIVLNRVPASIADRAIHGIPLVIKDRALLLRFMHIITREADDYREFVHGFYTISQRSASLIKEDREDLERTIYFLEEELGRYEYFSRMGAAEYQNDVSKRNDVERWIEKIVTASIDIAQTTLSSQKKLIPGTYRDAMTHVVWFFKLPEDFIGKFERWVKLRNVLAHEYLDIKWKKISDFIQNSESYFQKFLEAAKNFLRENEPRE